MPTSSSSAKKKVNSWPGWSTIGGWRLGARVPEKKLSPYLVSWGELAEEVRELDRLFIRGLPRFLAKAGFQIVRVAEPSSVGSTET